MDKFGGSTSGGGRSVSLSSAKRDAAEAATPIIEDEEEEPFRKMMRFRYKFISLESILNSEGNQGGHDEQGSSSVTLNSFENRGGLDEQGCSSTTSSGSSDESSSPSTDDDNFINYGTWTFLLQPYRHHEKLAVQYFNEDNNGTEEARKMVEKFGYPQRDGGPLKGDDAQKFPLDKFLDWFSGGPKSIVNSFVGGSGNEEPQLIIIFGTRSFVRLLSEWNENEFEGWDEWMDAIWGNIGDEAGEVDVITSFSNGLIGNCPGLRGIQSSLELENEELPCIAGLVIPKVAGVGTKLFKVTWQQNERLEKEKKISLGRCREILGITEEMEGKLKGIVFWHRTLDDYQEIYRRVPVVRVIHTYLKANRHVAMIGGLHPNVLLRGTRDDDVLACGFLVYGEDDRVRVNVAALLERGMPVANTRKLDKLGANLLTTGNLDEEVTSFGIMFGCFQRGNEMHGRYGVETEYFNKVLPKTQLVGAFDYGEFYREILDKGVRGRKRKLVKEIHGIHLSAFMVVSYVHPKY